MTVATPAGTVHWHPCLLAEITPHDRPASTGNHVWDDNNLAQKNISIVRTDAGQDFAIATVIGREENPADYLLIEINRGRLPREVKLFVDLLDPLLRRRLRKFDQRWQRESLTAEKSKLGSAAIAERRWTDPARSPAGVANWLARGAGGGVPSAAAAGARAGRDGAGRFYPLIVGGNVARGAKPAPTRSL